MTALLPAARYRLPGRITLRVPRPLLVGGILIGCSVVLALFPAVFAPYDPLAFDYNALMQAPGRAHPMGTDNFGRDVLSRVIHAYTVDMQIALFGTAFSFVFGTFIGALVGYAGGIADTVFGRIVDAVITFPFLVLVIAIVSVLGPGLVNMYIAIAVVGWVFTPASSLRRSRSRSGWIMPTPGARWATRRPA